MSLRAHAVVLALVSIACAGAPAETRAPETSLSPGPQPSTASTTGSTPAPSRTDLPTASSATPAASGDAVTTPPVASSQPAPPSSSPPASTAAPDPAAAAHALDAARGAIARLKAIDPPRYAGSGSTDDVKRFIEIRVRPWIQREMAAIEAAEKKALEVMKLGTPTQQIEVMSALAAAVAGFADDVSAVPTPAEWKTQPDVLEAYRSAVEGALAAIRNHARVVLGKCVAVSTAANVTTPAAASCASLKGKLGPGAP